MAYLIHGNRPGNQTATGLIKKERRYMSQESNTSSAETDTATATLTPADVKRLDDAVTDAEKKAAEATAKLAALMKADDMAAAIAQVKVKEAADRDVAKAKSTRERATYELRKEERMAASVELKAAVEKFVASVKLTKYIDLSLRGFSVNFLAEASEDGKQFNVSIGEPAQKAPKGTGKGAGSGPSIGRAIWQFGDESYTSRQLIEKYGGEAGEHALYRYDNWDKPEWGPNKDTPMASSPGFDAFAKSLGIKMGWNGENEAPRILTQEPA